MNAHRFLGVIVSLSSVISVSADHAVNSERELFIISPQIVGPMGAPGAAGSTPGSVEAALGGPWHIRTALQRIAGSGVDVDQYASAWFQTWATNETLPGTNDPFAKRPWVAQALQEAWDHDRIVLIAIVNRVDLARYPGGDTTKSPLTLGEGRFIYEVRAANNDREPFTIIFEYSVPFNPDVDTKLSIKSWAKRWHELGRPGITFTSPEYRNELVALTNEYSAHGTLNQIRTNEFLPPTVGKQLWELREFHHRERAAALVQMPVAISPAIAFSRDTESGRKRLAAFLEGKAADLISGRHDSLIREFQAAVAPVPSRTFKWTVPSGASATLERARFIFSFNTCNGCHAGDTGTLFQHIGRNAPALSPFLAGSINLEHPLPPEANTSTSHDEMGIRRKILSNLIADIMPAAAQSEFSDVIKARANRVH